MSLSLHSSLLLSANVLAICSPFFKRYRLNSFSYSRVYPDGARTELWSDVHALEHTFFIKKYIVGAYTPKYFLDDEKYIYLPSKVNDYPSQWKRKYTSQLVDQREYFNHDHCFMVVNRGLKFYEYFIFYTPVTSRSTLNFYFNNLDILENFSDHFKVVAADLIKLSDAERFTTDLSKLSISENNIPLFQDQKHRFTLSNSLSIRESQIAHLLLTGKTAREVGEVLHISKRTAESHIDHIKIKLNCHNKSDLINLLYKMNDDAKNSIVLVD